MSGKRFVREMMGLKNRTLLLSFFVGAVFFVVVFKWLHVNHAVVLITFGLLLVSQWIISLTLNNRY